MLMALSSTRRKGAGWSGSPVLTERSSRLAAAGGCPTVVSSARPPVELPPFPSTTLSGEADAAVQSYSEAMLSRTASLDWSFTTWEPDTPRVGSLC